MFETSKGCLNLWINLLLSFKQTHDEWGRADAEWMRLKTKHNDEWMCHHVIDERFNVEK